MAKVVGNSPEYQLFQSHYSALSSGIAPAVEVVAEKALEKRLIIPENLAKVKLTAKTEFERASYLVFILHGRIGVRAKDFYVILDILKSIPSLNHLVELLAPGQAGSQQPAVRNKVKLSVKPSELWLKCAIGALTSSMLGIAILLYWEEFPATGVLEKLGIAACLSGIFHFLLHLPYLVFSNKWYTVFLILMLLLTLATLKTILNNSTIYNVKHYDEEPDLSQQAPIQELKQLPPQPCHTSKQQQASKQEGGQPVETSSKPEQQVLPSSSQLHVQPSFKPEQPSSNDKFDGDCRKHSKWLLSQNVLTYPKKHNVKCQVEMFGRTIYLTGKPSYPVFSGEPSEYEGDALDIMDRHNSAGALSSLSVEDAIEKALVGTCEKLRRKGLDRP